MTGFCRNW